MIVQCETCGRVRLGQEWTHAPDVQPQIVGTCPTCLAWRQRVSEARRRREANRVARQAERGYGEPAAGVDVFRGFREGE